MKTHADKTYECSNCGKVLKQKESFLRVYTRPYVCLACHKSNSRRSILANHMKTHAEGSLHLCSTSDSHGSEATDQKDTLPTCNSSSSTDIDYRCENEGLPTCRSIIKEERFAGPHSSETPYIINVKQEEDI